MPICHTSWRCPACGTTVATPPLRETFCTNRACPDEYMPMVPHDQDAPYVVDPRLTTPELTADQRRYDSLMRGNRGLVER